MATVTPLTLQVQITGSGIAFLRGQTLAGARWLRG